MRQGSDFCLRGTDCAGGSPSLPQSRGPPSLLLLTWEGGAAPSACLEQEMNCRQGFLSRHERHGDVSKRRVRVISF